ncbi:hypothetical protein CEXT_116281 [Caerostris extrusa]|uniref:Uncharacterized protein n=1 Tax=Caerostris extrusa TaxID=172846 RepID=A0AAV4SQD4_CAEEX|nr:hypothetical protein CEXT_116281 [Caerostris extrusa]
MRELMVAKGLEYNCGRKTLKPERFFSDGLNTEKEEMQLGSEVVRDFTYRSCSTVSSTGISDSEFALLFSVAVP